MPRLPLLAALAAMAVTMLAFALVGPTLDAAPPSGDRPPGVALSADDRAVLQAPQVRRGVPAVPPDPAVDLADPEAVTRAFLAAAHSAAPTDIGATSLRGAAYTVSGTPLATVGVLVVDPPSPGTVRTASVRALQLVTVDRPDRSRAYRAEVGLVSGPPGAQPTIDVVVRDVVLARQSDGRWLVASDAPAAAEFTAADE